MRRIISRKNLKTESFITEWVKIQKWAVKITVITLSSSLCQILEINSIFYFDGIIIIIIIMFNSNTSATCMFEQTTLVSVNLAVI